MKTLPLAALTAITVAASAMAGETVHVDHGKKTYQPLPEPCFADKEWQVDVFGAYAFSSSSQDALFGDHAWGGGIGVNYFFLRHLGLGVEGSLFDSRTGDDILGQSAVNLFVRFPIDSACLSPYFYIGGGGVFNAEDVDDIDVDDIDDFDDDDDDDDDDNEDAFWEAHVGVGLEYRFKPNFGMFVDGRFTVVDKNDNNFATIRAGIRFAF